MQKKCVHLKFSMCLQTKAVSIRQETIEYVIHLRKINENKRHGHIVKKVINTQR